MLAGGLPLQARRVTQDVPCSATGAESRTKLSASTPW